MQWSTWLPRPAWPGSPVQLPQRFQAMNWFTERLFPGRRPLTPEQRARQLIAAIDAGGLPLNAAIINDIARQLGLEVSPRARMDDTVTRIRAALQRVPR